MSNLGPFITWVLNSFGHRKAMIDCFVSVKVFVKMSSTYKHYLVFDRSSSTSKNPCRKGHQKCLLEASNHHHLIIIIIIINLFSFLCSTVTNPVCGLPPDSHQRSPLHHIDSHTTQLITLITLTPENYHTITITQSHTLYKPWTFSLWSPSIV